jgi:hypothetical protein
VIAGNGEDRRGIIFEGLVELIVVILLFTVKINDITEMEKKLWDVGVGGCVEIGGHEIGDGRFVGKFIQSRRAGIAYRVKNNLLGILNGGDGAGGENLIERERGIEAVARAGYGFRNAVNGEVLHEGGIADGGVVVGKKRAIRIGGAWIVEDETGGRGNWCTGLGGERFGSGSGCRRRWGNFFRAGWCGGETCGSAVRFF